MIHPTQSEGGQDDWRQPPNLSATGTRRAQPSGTPCTASDAIAEDPALVCLAGRLISRAAAGNHVRFEKVDALRRAIEVGAYRVSSADLAEKLMDGLSD